ncbi:uncharacterized protein LOC113312869 [Papaver somniferum]|uniref:uncharacterized protein LOC113312869 n=1 Tax=Papaver somniferum TaxID=3469 RepID=UPI000E6FF14B|nr:uncharacterized protein LOC113312869 [Papaver somniferum]
MTSDGASTSGIKKIYRRTPILVINSEPHTPDADLNDNVVTSQVDDTVSVEYDTTASAMDNVWDIAAAFAYNAQNHTDAWKHVIVKTYPSLFIFALFFLLLFSCSLSLNFSVITVMKILSWNCQGIGNPHTRDYIQFCLTNNDPDIFFLCETKTQSNNMRFYLSKTNYPHYWFHPSLGLSGGISLGWKNGIDIEIMYTTSKTIHAIVHTHDNNMDFLITFMYGAHDDTENANQWQYLINMHLFVDLPWVLLGDLNFTMHDSETHSSSVTHPHHARHVRNFVQQLDLIDSGYSGADTTWSNHRSGDDHVSARLDRALVNNHWINHYTNAHLQHLVPVASDHCPILLHTVPSATKHSPFKLYKCWFKMDSCTDTIARSWQHRFLGSPSFQFSSKLKLTRTQLQIWKRLSFGNIENNLQNIQKQLQFCYDRNLPSSNPQVKHLSSSLQQWLLIQKEFFMQKAGDKFLEADRNTSYFHSIVNYNKRRSTINSIQGPLGIWFDSRSDIEAIFTNHFKNIATSSKPQINNEILQLFQPCVSEIQNNCLIQVPHAQETKDVVFQIKPWDSLGNDGFQAGFYQHCWDVVGTEQLQHFLHIFGQASGQVINMQKSTLFFGKHTSNAHKSNITGILGMKVMGLGEKYLGIPLLLHRSRHKNCQGVIDNMNNRLQGWQSKIVNQAGRTTQVNSVLRSMGMYQMQVFKLPEETLQQMERIQRSYWWNSYIKPRSQNYISWRKVCLPKRLGGLGLKNLCNYNLAFLAKLAWQLLHNQDALWAKLLKGKHFPHHDLRFFPPPVNLNSSWIWQSISIGLEIMLKNAKCQVGNGAHINIWTSNWIPSLNSALQDWGDLNISNYQLVSDLIDTDTEQWNVSLLRLLFTADQVNSILTIPIQLNQEDKLIWPFTTTGIFTTASTYKMLCDKDILTDNSMGLSQHFWLSFWKLKVPYKFQIFLWRAIHNAVPVKSRIFTHVHNADLHCVLCNHNQMEDLDHLLLHCPFSRAIWQYFLPHQFHFILQHSSLLSWIQTWQLKDSIINIQKSPEIVHLAMCIMHFIWKLRCRVVFNNITPNHNSVVHQVNSYILQHHLGNSPANYNHPNVHNKLLHHRWDPPPLQYLKINIDASYNSSSLLAGIGIIIRNSTGAYVMGRGALRRASNAQQAEAWAMLEAMQLADSNGWSHVIFESDNLGICSFLQQQSSLCHWQSMPLLRKCVNICNINPGWSCSFVYRSGNKAADSIAKAAYKHNLCGDWWFHPPPLLIPYISCDVMRMRGAGSSDAENEVGRRVEILVSLLQFAVPRHGETNCKWTLSILSA